VSAAQPGCYDDPVFFGRYWQLRERRAGLNEDLEQPAFAAQLPPVIGARVVDLGCGDGTLARWLADQGAQQVLGIDPSARMIERAAGCQHPRVRYCRARAESFSVAPGSLDLVVSSMALHYVTGYRALMHRIATWLRPGGHLVCSAEHPICTARNPMTGWFPAAGGALWPVDDYADEGPRTQQWLGRTVTKQHRRISTLVEGILTAGLTLVSISEPAPGRDLVARRPDLAQHRRRPPVLILSARKPENN
jgi:SAM-dependent methyltransferase